MMSKSVGKMPFITLIIMLMLVFVAACGDSEEVSPGDIDEEEKAETGSEEAEEAATGSGDTITFATSPVGANHNVVGNGLASVISTNSDLQLSVSPFAGTSAWGPLMDEGDIELGTASGPESTWAYNGEHDFEAMENMRLLVRGNFVKATGAVVREGVGYERVSDLAGERVAADYPGSIIGKMIMEATLVTNGLDWDDVNEVPVPSTTDGIEALQDDSLDAAFALVATAPIMQEVHNAIGLQALHFLDDYGPDQIDEVPQDIVDQIDERVPGAQMTTVEPEGYITQETVGIEYPNHVLVSDHVSDEVVYEILNTLWEHYEELHDVHAWLEQYTPGQMFDPEPTIPYHSGAIEFFEDQGLWDDDVEAVQQELLE